MDIGVEYVTMKTVIIVTVNIKKVASLNREGNRGSYRQDLMGPLLFGKMAERSNAALLKSVDLRGSGGSNPSLSANINCSVGQLDRPSDFGSECRWFESSQNNNYDYVREWLKRAVCKTVRETSRWFESNRSHIKSVA